MLVAVSIVAWPLLLVVAWALVFYPALGSGVVATDGPTPQDWPTALYFSGFSLTTLGTGDVIPASGVYRLLTVLEAAVGFAVVSMVVTYFLSLSSAIVQRKTFAAALDHRTTRTGDSARLITGLTAQGGLPAVTGQLSSTGEFLERVFQTHQSYPVLRYFHYREVRYALPRILLVTLDAAALVTSAVEGEHDDSPAIALVEGAARELLQELVPRAAGRPPVPGSEERWRQCFTDAVAAFRAAGLCVRGDDAAREEYVRHRRSWDGQLRALAAAMLYDWPEIEPVRVLAGGGSSPGGARPRRP